MKQLHLYSISLLVLLLFLSNSKSKQPGIVTSAHNAKLSDYSFFVGNLADMQPAERVIPYDLNTPLFSDYAKKARFVRLPKGTTVPYNATQVLDFPLGTAIIKTFYYPNDARKPEKGRQLLETRVLLHEADGWVALPYIWNDAQSEAYLDVAGDTKTVIWRDKNGKKYKQDYSIPNMNQCKGCHQYGDKLLPIGPSVRQLNGLLRYEDKEMNQLKKWEALGMLSNLPDLEIVPRLAIWDKPETGNLDTRARAYLDANCGHCHNPEGPANTSGLFLNIHEKNPAKWGLHKAPIAAGRGSGGRKVSIAPGKPDASMLVYRMESTDPGVMMPELSRKLQHKEGIKLIRDWISAME